MAKKTLEHGLILVDTKYEMGRTETGEIVLIDEIHTPDSSRYWIADTYEKQMEKNREPENIDKEFFASMVHGQLVILIKIKLFHRHHQI